MEIIRSSSSVHKDKPDGTRVDYYLQKEYEIHYNEIPPGTLQEWHYHQKLEEVIFMIEGQLEVRWVENNIENKEIVNKGDLIRSENTVHTFANVGDKNAVFIVFKIVLEGKDNSKIFKEDKVSANPTR